MGLLTIRSRLLAVLLAVFAAVVLQPSTPAHGQRSGDPGWVSTKVGAIGQDTTPTAKDRWLGAVTALAFDAQGRLFIAHEEYARAFISRVGVDGSITKIAGSAESSAPSPPGLALATQLPGFPSFLVPLSDGSLLILNSNQAWKLRVDGFLESWGTSFIHQTCSGVSTTVETCNIGGIRVDPSGDLLVTDFGTHSVYRVAQSGLLATRIAGTGVMGDGTFVSGANAIASSLSYPRDPVFWNGAVHFRNDDKTWRIETNGTLTEIVSFRSQTLNGGTYVRSFVGVSSGGSLLFSDGVSIYSHTPSGVRARVFGGGSEDPSEGVNGLNVLMGFDPRTTVQVNGRVAFVPRGTTVVFELLANGSLRHLAGRIEPKALSEGAIRGFIGSIERDDDGSILFSDAWWGNSVRRYVPASRSTIRLAGGSFNGPYPTANSESVTATMAAPGCSGEVFVNGVYGVMRISAGGAITRFFQTSSTSFDAKAIGGSCGLVVALDFDNHLWQLSSSGSLSDLGVVPGSPYQVKIRPDGSGGLFVASEQGLLRFSASRQWSSLSARPTSDVATAGGGWLLVLRQRNPSLGQYQMDLVEVSPSGSERVLVYGVASGDGSVLVDGDAGAVPLAISSIAYDPGGFIWVADQGRFIRTIRYSPPTGAPQSGGPSTTSQRRSATAGSVTVTTAGRVAAPSATG